MSAFYTKPIILPRQARNKCTSSENSKNKICGLSHRLSQLEDNLGALSVIPLITAEVQAKVEAVLENQPEPSGTSTMEMVNGRRGALEAGDHWLTPKL